MMNRVLWLACAGMVAHCSGPSARAADLSPLPNFTQAGGDLQITAPCVPRMPWTVAGEHGALLGRENGKFEAWLWPNKILSNFSIEAELADYPVPIDVNALAAEIKVTPAETVITYSHAAFTVRQHMFAARGGESPPTGVTVFFEIESVRGLNLTFSFTPEMLHMWPAPNFGRPNGEWIAHSNQGVYVLHTDDPNYSAIIAMPNTTPGIMAPYQERPQTYPLQLKLSYDPKRDAGKVYPLVLALNNATSPLQAAAAINAAIPNLYSQTQSYYSNFFAHRTFAETPSQRVNDALRWAEIAIDQMQVAYKNEIGLVAGFYESGDSARPGYAWFFGRDTLWTTYAINSYGDFALTRRALDFLIHRQREDGKIMHEFSQSAYALDWSKTPYFYASADATPLLIMAMRDYVQTSGDVSYLRANWPAIQKAYAFTRAHESKNGIYDNSQGTGWVESWPQGMPHQEIYLAALDQQSVDAMSTLANLLSDKKLAEDAKRKASQIRSTIESEFYNSNDKFYSFAENTNGTMDDTASIYPSAAWWDGTLALQHAGPMLSRWASPEFSTDWGTRDISDKTPFYDPISYHQGSVWPLFTGWVSLAEYRAGRSLSALAHLMQNADLTWAQDLGSVTELLSGAFYQPLGRSSSHQMWSSAMVISPMLRGLFGVSCDFPNKVLHVSPHLPADWDYARLQHLEFGPLSVELDIERNRGGKIVVRASTRQPETFCLSQEIATICKPAIGTVHTLVIAEAPIVLGIPTALPEQGSATKQLKVLDEEYTARQAVFRFSAQSRSSYDLPVRVNRPHAAVNGAEMRGDKLHLQFPDGNGYQDKTVTFSW